MRWILVLALIAAACSGESVEIDPDSLTETGGCSMMSTQAANPDWTEVLVISVQREALVARGATASTTVTFEVGEEGVVVRYDTGRNLANLYCNDFTDGSEVVTLRTPALSGMIRIELQQPIEEQFRCCDESQTVIIRATSLQFPGSDPFDITFPAHIGWYPG
jgi:hypothetical protein